MWDYSEKVKDHFFNPKNAGVLDGANAVGEVGALSCGDALKLMLKVDPVTQVIIDARFQTFGCGSAIASSSALTELVIGKTLDESATLSNQDIANFLGGLPPEKMHCSVLGYEALQAAIANYRGEPWAESLDNGALVCKCLGIEEGVIKRAIKTNKLTSIEQVTAYTKAGSNCLTCFDQIEEILANVNEELVAEGLIAERDAYRTRASIAFEINAKAKVAAKAQQAASQPAKSEITAVMQSSPLAPSPLPPVSSGMTNLQRIKLIEETIEELRPFLRKDGGDCELVDVDGSNILVKMSGACVLCKLSSATITGIQERLVAKLGVPLRVIPVGKGAFGKAGH